MVRDIGLLPSAAASAGPRGVSMVDIVVRALAACEAAFKVVPIEKWPRIRSV